MSPSCEIPDDELIVRVSRSGGPGGQHANTSNSQVEVVFSVVGSQTLGPRQKARLLEKLGPTIRAVSSDERSQLLNKERALARLAAKIRDGLHVDKPRVATRATKGSKERRLDAKRRTSNIKANRQGRYDD